jgi:hypothetical protein
VRYTRKTTTPKRSGQTVDEPFNPNEITDELRELATTSRIDFVKLARLENFP